MKQIDPAHTEKHLVEFIRSAFAHAGFSKAVIALSGGVDSATSCSLAVRALGRDNVYPVLLPYGALGEQGVADAGLVTEALAIPEGHVSVVDIEPLLAPVVALDPVMDNVRRGNAMARMRMMVVYDRAKKLPGLVIGTENKSEHYLGYFTRFGDEASDLEPLRNLYKTQVYRLASHLGVPEAILTKKPTAGLWEGQTDEGEFGFTYTQADEILSANIDQRLSVAQVIGRGIPEATVKRVLAHVEKNAFKHHLPHIPTDTKED